MSDASQNLFLMQADEKVLEFNINNGFYNIINEPLMPYSLKNKFKEMSKDAPIETLLDIRDHNRNIITHYLAGRILNLSRENAKKILNAYHFSQDTTDNTKARIAITCKAVSITDSYWISDGVSEWKDYNLRKNPLNQIVSHIALKGSSFTIKGRPQTPELTGQGAYAKSWVRNKENDKLYLLKRGLKQNNDKEIFIEESVSKILDCMNVNHVQYKVIPYEDFFVSSCCNIATEELSLVTAEEVYSYCSRNEKTFLKYCMDIDKESIMKMCVVDYLISNPDRHGKNWGFYKDNATGKLISCHPLFDHNNAFDEEEIKDISGGPSLIFVDKTKKEAAEYAIKRCNFKIISPIIREMFYNNECYMSFKTKAEVLNIDLCPKLDYQYSNNHSTLDLSNDQLIQVRLGIANGLTKDEVKCFLQKDFSASQMKEIRLGLEQGLSPQQISIYANSKYSADQMLQLRLGLVDGLDVTSFANPDIKMDDMAYIRIKLAKEKNNNLKRNSIQPQRNDFVR